MRVAIIPARGGSKRIPRKNIKPFFGQPMIAYSIKAARESGCFDRVIVSTDDLEIADVAKQYGAEVPFIRPAGISDDHATTMDVIQHAASWLAESGCKPSYICCIYATAPFVRADKLAEGLESVIQPDVDYAFSATTFPFPIQRALKVTEKGTVSMFMPEHQNTRSQDLEEAIHDAGQFYWGTYEAFCEGRAIFSEQSMAIMLPRIEVQDIDTQEDWETAEGLFALMEKIRS